MRSRLYSIAFCGFIVLSQHASSDGTLWWRQEAGPVPASECRAKLKAVTGRPKVGFSKWYDVTPALLDKHFGSPPIAEKGTWLGCWPEGTALDEPDS